MTKRHRILTAFSVLAACALPTANAQEAWPGFRGHDGLGHYSGALPTTWTAESVVWRTELSGQGQSSPCIWGDRVFLTSATKAADGKVERHVLCLDRDSGERQWDVVVHTGSPEKVHPMNSFASSTCVTDGETVFAFFGRGGLHAVSATGDPRWSRGLGTFPGPWGTAASPILVEDLVIQNCDAQGASALIAFDKATGKTVWETKRPDSPRGGWNTPIVVEHSSRRDLVLNGEDGIRGYDLETGEERWFCKSFNGRGTPTPAVDDKRLYVMSGKPGDIYALRLGGEGTITATHMDWHTPRKTGRDLGSPILVGSVLFSASMGGDATAYNAADGRQLWQEKLAGKISASPIAANGLIYLQDETGVVHVIRPGATFSRVATNPSPTAEKETFRSTPAPANGRIYMRSDRAAYCIGR